MSCIHYNHHHEVVSFNSLHDDTAEEVKMKKRKKIIRYETIWGISGKSLLTFWKKCEKQKKNILLDVARALNFLSNFSLKNHSKVELLITSIPTLFRNFSLSSFLLEESKRNWLDVDAIINKNFITWKMQWSALQR